MRSDHETGDVYFPEVRQGAERRRGDGGEALGRMAVGVAHELNNLLGVIFACCAAVEEEGSLGAEARGYLEEMKQTCRRAGELTRELLALGRPVRPSAKRIDLNDVLTESEGVLRRVVPAKVDLHIEHCREPALVTADRTHIHQILLNLALNARDAMPAGGRLSIELDKDTGNEAAEEDRRTVDAERNSGFLITVSDTGTGIAPEIQGQIFEPFATTKDAAGGTGLGLFTVAEIVGRLGGSIDVETAPGKGTTFRIRLPAADVPGAARAAGHGQDSVRGSETVLLVQDDAYLCESLRGLLSSVGYRVLTAHSARAATRIAEEHPAAIHLLLADAQAQAAGGPDFIKALRASQPGIRVLYTADERTHTASSPSGADPEIPAILKPHAQDELLAAVREVLRPARDRRFALVVDEDPTWREAASRPLEDRGYEVVTAENGDEAVGLLKQKKFDLCVVELEGAGTGDADVLRTIRRECSRSVAIVATGCFHGNLMEAAYSSGADAVMQKPYSREDLLLVLDTYLDAGRDADQVSRKPDAGRGGAAA